MPFWRCIRGCAASLLKSRKNSQSTQPADVLTEREIGVLRRVAAGPSNKIIAGQLSLTEATVKAHMRSILSKLEANDHTHAVTIAMR